MPWQALLVKKKKRTILSKKGKQPEGVRSAEGMAESERRRRPSSQKRSGVAQSRNSRGVVKAQACGERENSTSRKPETSKSMCVSSKNSDRADERNKTRREKEKALRDREKTILNPIDKCGRNNVEEGKRKIRHEQARRDSVEPRYTTTQQSRTAKKEGRGFRE